VLRPRDEGFSGIGGCGVTNRRFGGWGVVPALTIGGLWLCSGSPRCTVLDFGKMLPRFLRFFTFYNCMSIMYELDFTRSE
jgi:hypothetical protein